MSLSLKSRILMSPQKTSYGYLLIFVICQVGWANSIADSKTNLLAVIPGFGFHCERTITVLKNLDIIRRSNISIHCMIFVYGNNISEPTLQNIKNICDVHYYNHANFGNYIKSVSPYLVRSSNYSHVMILLDDVELVEPFRYEITLLIHM